MPDALQGAAVPRSVDVVEPLAVRLATALAAVRDDALPAEVVAKVKLCLRDLVGCAFESRHLPWSRQALALVDAVPGRTDGATLIGHAQPVATGEAAFANAVMGHGLVREDMHSGSISHLGIVVLPTLMALAESRRVSGRAFIAAAMAGYEVGGRIGRAVMDAQLARIHRPTGITGPFAAVAAAARLLGLDVPATTSALALAANTPVGFNQWAHTGGSEMFFHPGFVARNAITAVRLAAAGAFASPSAIDGEAGLFAALRKPDAAAGVRLFDGAPEILSVYHKPVPACNFAQTPCQAALAVARQHAIAPERIAAIHVRVSRAGALYPGCDARGPFAHILQAKMSIQFNVAAALLRGRIAEDNFTLLDDPVLHGLIGRMTLEVDDAMTRAYPGLQGGEVTVRTTDGAEHRVRLDDVVNATADDVQARFRAAIEDGLGAARAGEFAARLDALDTCDDVGAVVRLLRGA